MSEYVRKFFRMSDDELDAMLCAHCYLDALHKHHGDRRFDTIYAGAPQRRGVAPMHAGHPRRDRAMFQREED